MQFFKWFHSVERKAWIGFIVTVALLICSVSNMVFAGSMGWVYEQNKLRTSYPDQTW